MKGEQKIWLAALGFVALYGGIVVWAYPLFSPDVACRYAPMADEFARGNWELAFHPRFGVFFQCVSGLIACLGVRGDHACQLASTLLLGLSAVPIWHLVRKLFGETAAWWTVALVLLCDDFARYAADGLRDTGKCLAYALLGWGVVSRRSLWFACGVFVLTTLVSYGFAISCAVMGGWMLWWILRKDWCKLVLPIVAFAAATFLVSLPVHSFTGHWLPNPSFIKVFGRWL